MAKPKKLATVSRKKPTPKRTSIGTSRYSRPLNKHKRANWKAYRGQGKKSKRIRKYINNLCSRTIC